MFAIYNLNGRLFRDKLETLQKVKKPHHAVKNTFKDDIIRDETTIIQGSSNESIPNRNRIATYRQMLNTNEKVVIVHAYQVMSHPVITINDNINVKQANEYFQKHLFNQIPVFNPQVKLVGLISHKEILQANYKNPHAKITDLITTDVITADPISDIRRVASVLYNYKLSALPIVNEQDHLVGIISKTDILKAVINDPPLSLWT